MSVPVFKLVLEGVDAGEERETIIGRFRAHRAFAERVTDPLLHLADGERVAWVTLFSLHADGWLLEDMAGLGDPRRQVAS